MMHQNENFEILLFTNNNYKIPTWIEAAKVLNKIDERFLGKDKQKIY